MSRYIKRRYKKIKNKKIKTTCALAYTSIYVPTYYTMQYRIPFLLYAQNSWRYIIIYSHYNYFLIIIFFSSQQVFAYIINNNTDDINVGGTVHYECVKRGVYHIIFYTVVQGVPRGFIFIVIFPRYSR